MNVRELKKLLASFDEDAIVVVPGPDHSYRKVRPAESTAIKEDGGLGEDHDPFGQDGLNRVNVVVFV